MIMLTIASSSLLSHTLEEHEAAIN